MLIPITAGSDATAAQIDAAFDVTRVLYQVSDQQVNNSTALISSSNLVFPVAASASYLFEGHIFCDTNTTADFKNSISIPSGTGLISPWGSDTSAASVSASIEHDGFTALTWATGGVGSGTIMSSKPTGILTIGTSAGNVVFQFAQQTANVSNTILKAGSFIRLTKVS